MLSLSYQGDNLSVLILCLIFLKKIPFFGMFFVGLFLFSTEILNFRGRLMTQYYDPHSEAQQKGIGVIMIPFSRINSFLTKSVIYLRESMTAIEKRCSLTYELVHHSRNHFSEKGFCTGHSLEEENYIRQEAAKKLVPPAKLHELLNSAKTLDQIAQELYITREVLEDYLSFCLYKQLETAKVYVETR